MHLKLLANCANLVDPTPLNLKVFDVGVGSVNLTWGLSVGGADQSFLLTISHGAVKVYLLLSPTTTSLLLKVPHPVRSTTSLSLPLMLVPPTLELVAVYPAQWSAPCYLLYLALIDLNLPWILCWVRNLVAYLSWSLLRLVAHNYYSHSQKLSIM